MSKTGERISVCEAEDHLLRQHTALLSSYPSQRLIPSTYERRTITYLPLSTGPGGWEDDGEHILIRGRAHDARDLRETLSRSCELLAILTHSDGVDAMLAANLTLCSVAIEEPRSSLPCVTSNWCYRLQANRRDSAASGRLLSPALWKARHVIFAGCNSVPARESALNWSSSLVARMFESRYLQGALVGAGVIHINEGDILSAIECARGGASLREIWALLNRCVVAHHSYGRFALFGDGDGTPCSERSTGPSASRTETTPSSDARTGLAFISGLAFLEQCALIRLDVSRGSSASASSLLNAVLWARSAVVLGSATTTIHDTLGGVRRAMHSLMRDFRAPLGQLWLGVGRCLEMRALDACPSCGAGTGIGEYSLGSDLLARRFLVHCFFCGIIADVTSPTRASMTVEPTTPPSQSERIAGTAARVDAFEWQPGGSRETEFALRDDGLVVAASGAWPGRIFVTSFDGSSVDFYSLPLGAQRTRERGWYRVGLTVDRSG